MTDPREGHSQPPQIWRYYPKRRKVDRNQAPTGFKYGRQNRPAEQHARYSIRDFLTVLFKQKRIIVTFFTAAMVTVAIGLILKRPEYQATAAILVKKTRAETPISATQTQAIVNRLSLEDLNSEVEILRNREIVEASQARLGPPTEEPPGLLARAKQAVKRALGKPVLSDAERRVLSLERRLSFNLIPRSNVIEIKFRHESPDRAAEVVGVFLEEYLAHRVAVHHNAQAASFFDAQTEIAVRELTEAETALEEYARGANVSVPIADQKQLALERLDQFERSLAQANVDVQREESRVLALEGRLSSVPERLPTANRQNEDSETERINETLVQLRLERDGLITRGYGPTNVRVRDLDAQIQLAEERLGEAEQRVGSINRTQLNEVHQQLKSQLLAAEADLAGTRAQYGALRVQVEDFRAELVNLNERSLDFTRLMREANAAEQGYLLYRQKRDEARVSQAMDQQNMVNVSVARAPRRPLGPAGASKGKLFASALVLVTIGSVGIAFAMDFMDRSFTTGEDLERGLGIPHLASIPHLVEVHATGTSAAANRLLT